MKVIIFTESADRGSPVLPPFSGVVLAAEGATPGEVLHRTLACGTRWQARSEARAWARAQGHLVNGRED